MYDKGCLIIDDIGPALAAGTDLGREILTPPVERVGSAVRRFADLHGWPVIRHDIYAKWATTHIETSTLRWIVLDPFFRPSSDDLRFRPVRLTRRHGANGCSIAHSSGDLLNPPLAGLEIGILDDAVSSGRTVAFASDLITERGGLLREVAICASSRIARERLRAAHPNVDWIEQFPGDWRVIHMRDGCPHLPYSARATEAAPVSGAEGALIEVRIPPTQIAGNLWQVLWLDREVRESIVNARAEVAVQLTAHFGRPALVKDLSCLGERIPVLVDPGQKVSGESRLDNLVPEAVPR